MAKWLQGGPCAGRMRLSDAERVPGTKDQPDESAKFSRGNRARAQRHTE